MHSLPNAMPEDFFGTKRYPKTRAWITRYDAAIEKAKDAAPKPEEVDGPDAVDIVLASQAREEGLQVNDDPLRLKKGDHVEMWPIDTGYCRKDSGQLIKLTSIEVAIAADSERSGEQVQIHYPRWNYTIARAGSKANGA